MKKLFFLFISGLLCHEVALGQSRFRHLGTAGVNVPVGQFAATHLGGIGIGYSRNSSWIGKLKKPPHLFMAFTARAEVAYYVGKKELVSGYPFRNGNYLSGFLLAGIIVNPVKKINISLTAGPHAGLQRGNGSIGFGSCLEGNLFFNERMAITPSVFLQKHSEANALWAVGLRLSYGF